MPGRQQEVWRHSRLTENGVTVTSAGPSPAHQLQPPPAHSCQPLQAACSGTMEPNGSNEATYSINAGCDVERYRQLRRRVSLGLTTSRRAISVALSRARLFHLGLIQGFAASDRPRSCITENFK